MDISLNLTRFIAHQLLPQMLAGPWTNWDLGEPNLRTLPSIGGELSDAMLLGGEIQKEIPLDSTDNVLMGVRTHSLGRSGSWPMHLRRYIEGLENAVTGEFMRAANLLGPHLSVHPLRLETHYNLHKVETYFEFFDSNPTRLVRLLEPMLLPIGIRNVSRSFPRGRAECASDENARSVLITLRGGRHLRVYAKTTKRIRFEVIHDLKNPALNSLLRIGENRKTTLDLDELMRWFNTLAEDAAATLNEVFSEIEAGAADPTDIPATTYDLMGAVYSTVRDSQRAEELLKLLVENGFIRTGHGAAFLAEIRKLRRNNVLRHVPGGSDSVTLKYRDALNVLRSQAGVKDLPGGVNNY